MNKSPAKESRYTTTKVAAKAPMLEDQIQSLPSNTIKCFYKVETVSASRIVSVDPSAVILEIVKVAEGVTDVPSRHKSKLIHTQ